MTQTFYVDPAAGSSGDGSEGSPFQSVRDAQTALETAFATATEDYVINLLAGEDTQQFASGAWTIGAGGSARTLRFIASGADRHTGVRGTGYRNSNASGLSWVHSNTSVTLEVVGVSAKYLQGGGSTSTVTVFDSCLSTDAAGDAVTIRGGTGTVKNCAAYQFAGDGFVSVNDVSTPTTKWLNCTAIGGAGNGYRRYAGTSTAKNCYSGGNTTAPYSGTIGKTNCAHDTAAVITGSTASVAYTTSNFTNVTSGAQDGKLPSGSALIGAGVGPSSDADIPATDFEGDARSGTTTDIGFDQRATGGAATALPGVGGLSVTGLAPTPNAFTGVHISEVLINEAGSPVSGRTGIHLMVWYSGFPVGAADLSYTDMTTDANGTASWSLATGSLMYGQRIFYVAHDGHTSLSTFTCAQMRPTYS